MAQLAFGAVAAIGASAMGMGGYAGMAFSLGSMIGGMLFNKGTHVRTEGPRLADKSVQGASYGSPITRIWGTVQIAGTMLWTTDIVEESSTKTQRAGKGGGGQKVSHTTYTYYGNFAVMVCEGPVRAVRRVLMDGKVIWDASNPDTGRWEKYPGCVTVYRGTDDQLPDPTMEAHLGVGNVPAYRGRVIVVFRRLPLADFGNRIPQVEVEVTQEADEINSLIGNLPITNTVNPYGNWLPSRQYPYAYWDDAANGMVRKTHVVSGVHLASQPLQSARLVDDEIGRIWSLWWHPSRGWRVQRLDEDTLAPTGVAIESMWIDGFAQLAVSSEQSMVVVTVPGMGMTLVFDSRYGGDELVRLQAVPSGYTLGRAVIAGGSIWVPMHGGGGCKIREIKKTGLAWQQTDYDVSGMTGAVAPQAAFDTVTGYLLIWGQPTSGPVGILRWNPTTKTTVGSPFPAYHQDFRSTVSGRICVALPKAVNAADHVDLGAPAADYQNGAIWGWTELSTAAWAVPDRSRFIPLKAAGAPLWSFIDIHTQSVVMRWQDHISVEKTQRAPFGVFSAEKIGLGSIIADMCGMCGLADDMVDVAAVSDQVRGFFLGRMSDARAALGSLVDAFALDVAESGGRLVFRSRAATATPIITVPHVDLGASDGGGKAVERISETRGQELELPRRVTVHYRSWNRGHEVGSQIASRYQGAVATHQTVETELPLVLEDAQAAAIAERMLMSSWIGRTAVKTTLPPRYMQLDPGDVVLIEARPGRHVPVRIMKLDLGASLVVAVEGRIEDDRAYVSTLSGVDLSIPTLPPRFVGPSRLHLIDGPALLDGDAAGPCVYVAVSPVLDAWTGAGVQKSSSVDGDYGNVMSDSSGVTWGVLDQSVAASQADTWDETTKIRVRLLSGELESRPAIDILNGANALAIGPRGQMPEIVQFRTATEVSDGVWELSGLLRGRRGTEHRMAHDAGEPVVLLDGVTRVGIQSSEIGVPRWWRTWALGAEAPDPSTEWTVSDAGMRPYSPVHVRGARSGSGDLTVTWIRRTRTGGGWTDGADVPLGEESERYEVDFLDGYGNVRRTLTSTTPSVLYTAAQQEADFGSVRWSGVIVNVCQMSAAVGRGIPAQATV